MSKFKQKLQAVWSLLKSNGYVVMCSPNPLDEETDVEFFYYGFSGDQMVLICDSFSDDIESLMKEEEDRMMSDRIGEGMINFINFN